MRVFPVEAEHSLDVAVQRPQHSDPRIHQRPSAFSSHDQRLGRRLTCGMALLGLRELHEVVSGILQVTSWRPRGNGIGSSNWRDHVMGTSGAETRLHRRIAPQKDAGRGV
jgi:hypothetical protein